MADELRAAGRTPYPMGRGGATAVGALGYLTAARELAVQLADADCAPTATLAGHRLVRHPGRAGGGRGVAGAGPAWSA